MKYSGIVFSLYHEDGRSLWEYEPPSVTAVLTPTHVSIDYKEDNDILKHVEATSSNGVDSSGHWGYPVLKPQYPVQLQLFESKIGREVVLIETWENKVQHREGVYIFRL